MPCTLGYTMKYDLGRLRAALKCVMQSTLEIRISIHTDTYTYIIYKYIDICILYMIYM